MKITSPCGDIKLAPVVNMCSWFSNLWIKRGRFGPCISHQPKSTISKCAFYLLAVWFRACAKQQTPSLIFQLVQIFSLEHARSCASHQIISSISNDKLCHAICYLQAYVHHQSVFLIVELVHIVRARSVFYESSNNRLGSERYGSLGCTAILNLSQVAIQP